MFSHGVEKITPDPGEKGTWSCVVCTFENQEHGLACLMCQALAPRFGDAEEKEIKHDPDREDMSAAIAASLNLAANNLAMNMFGRSVSEVPQMGEDCEQLLRNQEFRGGRRALFCSDVFESTGIQDDNAIQIIYSYYNHATIAVGCNGQIIVVSAGSGALLRTVPVGNNHKVKVVSFSPDGKWLVAGGTAQLLEVWDTETYSLIKHLEGHTGTVTCASFSACGSFLATGSDDKAIKIWRTDTWCLAKTLKGHTEPITALCFSPGLSQETFLVSGGMDKAVKFWEFPGCRIVRELSNPSGVTSLSMSRDGGVLASSCSSGGVNIWNVANGQHLGSLKGQSAISSIHLTPSGHKVATAGWDKSIKIWDLSRLQDHTRSQGEPEELAGHSGCTSLSCSPYEDLLASAATEDKAVRIWDLTSSTKTELRKFQHNQPIFCVCFSP